MQKLTVISDYKAKRIAKIVKMLSSILLMENPEEFYSADYHISEDVDKPYYVLCYWNLGSNGFFADKTDILNIVRDKFDRPEGESYWIRIIDVESGDILRPIIKDVELEIDEEEYLEYQVADDDAD